MKKKKTVHLRKTRNFSQNKRKKYFANKFSKLYDQFFYGKFKKKKKLFYSLFLFFHCMGSHKILNYFKHFGITKSYKNFIYKKKSLKILKLYKKHKKKIYLYKKKKKLITLLKVLFLKKFLLFSKIHKIRYKNVQKKKELCLYFSYRHILYLPVRGQRTKTNAKTRKDFNVI